MSSAYDSLDPRVRKWVYKQGWSTLRPLQESSIPAILARDRDVLISAGTAAGKTEAFFLPACSAVADLTNGFGIVYISPLKALINDQYRRLESLGDALEMPVTPWHGDVPQSKKKKARTNPAGILLITPESLESLLINSMGWLKQAFSSVAYIVIDEFHAFIGSERGVQLLSLLNRIDHVLGRQVNPIPRVALSATLGELEKVPEMLRPNKRRPCVTVTDSNSTATLQVQVKGYLERVIQKEEELQSSAEHDVCADIFRLCRGDSHLVFANSRKRTESIAATLSDMCEEQIVPNEFFPHHGSLAKELREALESRLQKGNLPTTAVCTMTLELGIDIGKVKSVSKKVDYADTAARNLFAEGCSNFQRYNLQNEYFITSGQHCYVIPWMGDKVVNTITALLIRCGFKANSFVGVIEIDDASVATVQQALKKMLLSGLPSAFDLATDVPEKYLDKYDEYLPESLLTKGFGEKAYDIEGTHTWLKQHLQQTV